MNCSQVIVFDSGVVEVPPADTAGLRAPKKPVLFFKVPVGVGLGRIFAPTDQAENRAIVLNRQILIRIGKSKSLLQSSLGKTICNQNRGLVNIKRANDFL